MTRRLPLVTQLQVHNPCTANWDAMPGNDQVRYCAQCREETFNLSAMPPEQVEALLARTGRPACVRYRPLDAARGMERSAPTSAALTLALAAATLSSAGSTEAQAAAKDGSQAAAQVAAPGAPSQQTAATGPDPIMQWCAERRFVLGKASVTAFGYGSVDHAEEAVREGQAAAAAHPNDTTQQRQLAKLYDEAGRTSGENGLGTQARMYLTAASDIRRRLAQEHPEDLDLRSDLAASEESTGHFELGWSGPAEALPHLSAALQMRAQLAARKPKRIDWQRDLARSYELLGRAQQAQGQLDHALASSQATLTLRQNVARKQPTNEEWQRELIQTHRRIAEIQTAQADLAAAVGSLRAAVAIAQDLSRVPGKTTMQTRYTGLCAQLQELQRRMDRGGQPGR